MDACRPLFTWMRTLKNYGLVQDFQEHRRPRLTNMDPTTPPYTWWDEGSKCAVRIKASDPRVSDSFSFRQARTLATEVVEDCQDSGGWGGIANIGRHQAGWTVRVFGLELGPQPPVPSTTFSFRDEGVGNMTVIEGLNLDSDGGDVLAKS
ncbi:hypothetical protein N7G274_010224 [Stereocaulon virgatum]|uniref:Uncharacterized protein n=1 Tax=Stereocaulon virgatum TaxID=373712 RepID=A0ABR3ZYE2_9LECA